MELRISTLVPILAVAKTGAIRPTAIHIWYQLLAMFQLKFYPTVLQLCFRADYQGALLLMTKMKGTEFQLRSRASPIPGAMVFLLLLLRMKAMMSRHSYHHKRDSRLQFVTKLSVSLDSIQGASS